LRESLTSTWPGQVGFDKGFKDNYGYYYAKRVPPNKFSSCSSGYTLIPDFIPRFREYTSGDCIIFIDDNDYAVGLKQNPNVDNQQVISIDLFDSLDNSTSSHNPVPVEDLDICDPIVVAFDLEVVPGFEYNVIKQLASDLESLNDQENITVPYCKSRHRFGETWLYDGCSLIQLEQNRAWCSCTHLTDLSFSFKDLNISWNKVFTNLNTQPVNFDTVKSQPTTIVGIILILLVIRLLPEVQMRTIDRELLAQPCIFTDTGFELVVVKSVFYRRYRALAQKTIYGRFWALFLLEFRNNHPIFGIWLRDYGTNYTGHQRVIVVFAGLGTALATEALFYGITWSQPMEEFLTTAVVSVLVSIFPFFAKFTIKKHNTKVLDEDFKEEKSQMQECRITCRLFCCCFLLEFSKCGREILRTFFLTPGDIEKSLLDVHDKQRMFQISDRRQAIVQGYKNTNAICREIKVEDHEFKKLEKWQSVYLKKQYKCPLCLSKLIWPACMRQFAWILLLLYLICCMVVIVQFGVNFDKDETAEVPPQIVAEAQSECRTRNMDGIQLVTDVAVYSIHQFNAYNISAEHFNNDFTRYPPSTLKLFSDDRTEAFRFLSAAIVAWIAGIFIIPLIKNAVAAGVTLFIYRRFPGSVKDLCERQAEKFKGEEKLHLEDFKFLLFFFPSVLLDKEEYMAAPLIIHKGCCPTSINSCAGFCSCND